MTFWYTMPMTKPERNTNPSAAETTNWPPPVTVYSHDSPPM